MRLEYYFEVIPLLKGPAESGDMVFLKELNDRCFFGIVDALGHGKKANKAASLAVGFLEENIDDDLANVIMELHDALVRSIGVVIALCMLNKNNGELTYSGIGNISVKLLGSDRIKFVPRDGIVGFNMPSPKNQCFRLNPGDIIIISSDGVKENFDLLDFPGIVNESAENITSKLLKKYSKRSDDISLLTLKVLRW